MTPTITVPCRMYAHTHWWRRERVTMTIPLFTMLNNLVERAIFLPVTDLVFDKRTMVVVNVAHHVLVVVDERMAVDVVVTAVVVHYFVVATTTTTT